MSVWLWVVVAFVAGALMSAGIGAALRRGSDAERRLHRLRREYEQYQAEVARHFSQTGEFLSRLRTAFDQLYNEVEDRANSLVAEESMQRRLDYLDNDDHVARDASSGEASDDGEGAAAAARTPRDEERRG